MASTTDFTPNEPGPFCSVCRNLDFHSPLPGEDEERFLSYAWPFLVFSRYFYEFANSADQGCATCWVLANIGRLWDDSIDPASQIHVNLLAGGDKIVSCIDIKPSRSLDIYVPKDNLLCQ